MKDDIINRQAAIDAVKDADVCVFYSDNQSIDDVLDYTIRATKGSVIASIEQMPSAQTEIIRCKDCANYDTDWTPETAPDRHYCLVMDGMMPKDGFCSFAERRIDE